MKMQHRRAFLMSAAAVSASIAGCSGSESETDRATETGPGANIDTVAGPGELAIYDANWATEADNNPTVGTAGRVELLVGNRGGEPVSFDGSFAAESLDADPESSAIIDSPKATLTAECSPTGVEVKSGETVTVTTGSITPLYAGDYQPTLIKSTDEQLSAATDQARTLRVTPRTGSIGDFVEITESLSMAVDAIQFEQALHYATTTPNDTDIYDFRNERTGLLQTLPNRTFAIVTATVRNSGSETTRIDDAGIVRLTGQTQDTNAVEKTLTDFETETLGGVNIPPGSAATGILVYRLDRAELDDPTVGFSRAPNSSIAEAQYDVSRSGLTFPSFTLTDIDVPQTFSSGDSTDTLTFTVNNEGDGGGTIRAAIEWREQDASEYEKLLPGNTDLEVFIPPGETRTLSVETAGYDEPVQHRILPFGETFTIEPA